MAPRPQSQAHNGRRQQHYPEKGDRRPSQAAPKAQARAPAQSNVRKQQYDPEKGHHPAQEAPVLEFDEEDLTRDQVDQAKLDAREHLQTGDLKELINDMFHILDERFGKHQRDETRQKKSQALQLADVQIVLSKIPGRGGVTKKEKLPELKLSDRFWLFAMTYYAKFVEGWGTIPFTRTKAGFTAIPVAGNAFQMFCAPIIMVGIPKWTRCPPSVMFGVWWRWALATLIGFIPFLGTIYQVRKAPTTLATQRLIVYLRIRQLLTDSDVVYIGKGRRKKQMFRSRHLQTLLGGEITYSAKMHHDIMGTWGGCCSCCW